MGSVADGVQSAGGATGAPGVDPLLSGPDSAMSSPAVSTLSALLTPERFATIFDGVPPVRQALYRVSVLKACSRYGITNPEHLSAALAQWAHETGGGRWMQEIWGPTKQQERYDPPSLLASNLGNTQAGDGEKFRGRGLCMLTGRANYRDASVEFGLPLQDEPWLVAEMPLAALVGAWFFCRHNLTGMNFEEQTRRLNGGLTGMPDRLRRWSKVRRVLGLS